MERLWELTRFSLRNLGDSLAASVVMSPQRARHFDDVYYPITAYREYPCVPPVNSVREYVRLSTQIAERAEEALGREGDCDAIRAVVCAEPGGGKTFFLTRVASLTAQQITDDELFNRCVGLFGEEISPQFPVLADLGLLHGDTHGDVMDALYRASISIPKQKVSAEEFRSFVTGACERGEVLLLLDNADASGAADFLVALNSWLSDYPFTNVILSASRMPGSLGGFAPFRLRGLVSQQDMDGFAAVWFDADDFDPERGMELLFQHLLHQGYDYRFSLCGNPMYFCESLRFITGDPTLDDEYDSRMIDCALRRYAESVDTRFHPSTARLLLTYIAAAVCFGEQNTLSRTELTRLSAQAADEFDTEDVTPDEAFLDFLRNGFFVEDGDGYRLYFPEHILHTLTAGAVISGDAPEEYSEAFLIAEALRYPEIAAAAAARDSFFAKQLFRSLTPMFEEEGPRAFASCVLAARALAVCHDIGGTDVQLFYRSFARMAQIDVVVLEILFSSPRHKNDFMRFARQGFADSVADGGDDFAFALASCEVFDSRIERFCGVFQRLDDLLCSDAREDTILGLHVLMLMCGAIACYPAPDEQMAGFLGFGYTQLILTPRAERRLNELVDSFDLRRLLADAIQSAFFAGVIARDTFVIDDEECIRRLKRGRDEAMETLLSISDLFSGENPSVRDEVLLLKYWKIYEQILYTPDDPEIYRTFKVFAALGGFGDDLLPNAMGLQKHCMERMEHTAAPDDNVLYINADSRVEMVTSSEGERYLIVCQRGESGDALLERALHSVTDRLALRNALSILLRRGVLTRVLRVTRSGLRDETAASLLREGCIVKDNLTLINRVLYEYDSFEERVSALEELLRQGRFPRQRLDKNVVLFYKQQAIDVSKDGLEVLVLLDRVYADELEGRAYELEKLIKDSGVVVYENATHYAYLERLNETINILNSFLKEGK